MKILTKNLLVLSIFYLFLLLPLSTKLFAQGSPRISGAITNGATGKAVDFGTIIIFEAQKKSFINSDGTYNIYLPKNGNFTIEIRVDGLRSAKQVVAVSGNTIQNFTLQPLSIAGSGITIRGDKKQDLSRRSLAVDDLDAVPATFGDPISALASLPGVMRHSGSGGGGSTLFGELAVRGMNPSSNRYFVDGVPIQYPQHFGGLHSVVANEMMTSIDLYSSAFPAEFNGGMGSVIQINTLDDVDTFGFVSDFSILSSTALVKTPLYSTNYINGMATKEKNGYLIVSGRVGYLSLLVPIIYEMINGDTIDQLPNYWDYQVKYKQYLNHQNSITLMLMGARDWWDYDMTKSSAEDEIEDGMDPLLANMHYNTNMMFHNQSLQYKFSSNRITNKLIAYSCLPYYFNSYNMNNELISDTFNQVKLTTNPFEFGIKDEFSLEYWKDHGELILSAGYTNYYFKQKGDIIITKEFVTMQDEEGVFGNDEVFSNQDHFEKQYVDKTYINHLFFGHIANRFTYGGLTFIPQIRVEHLDRAEATVIDPRVMAKYEFTSATTVSAASGLYHEFAQTNPQNFEKQPEYAGYGKRVEPERSVHNSLGVKQGFGQYTASIEGFYNYYYNMLSLWPNTKDGEYIPTKNEGEKKSYGAEILVKRDALPYVNDFFGWVSYTYTQSEEKSNVPISIDTSGQGERWLPSSFEQEHALKLVAGYKYKQHAVTAQFQLYSSTPYTEVIGSKEDMEYYNANKEDGKEKHRYVPIYSNDVNGKHIPIHHQMDLRYTYTASPSWGSVKWYVECIDVYGYLNPEQEYKYRYDQPYGKNNPSVYSGDDLTTLPNLGVEISF